MARRPFLVTAVTLIASWACDGDVVRDASPLTFAIREGYFVDPPPPPPHIALLVATETQYPCMNYWLESELDVGDNMLRVSVSDRVRKPGVCLTAIGPAQYKVALPITVGTYTLEFTRHGLTDRYSVAVTASAIEITTQEAHFTRPIAVSFPRAGQ
jgi:hypothetical protein